MKVYWLLVLGLILAAIWPVYSAIATHRAAAECEQRGGVYARTTWGHACVKAVD